MSAVMTSRTFVAPRLETRGGTLETLVATLRRWRQLARSRRDLARLSDAQLRDVGLDPETARVEADRPFWDAPSQMR